MEQVTENKEYKEFLLADIAVLSYGNKFDKNKMTRKHPVYNFVSRTATNNGISDFVDAYHDIKPFPAGSITLAFGGSIGSCFVQPQDYYTGQNVGVIELPEGVTTEAKLYFTSALEKTCKAKYVTFSDEINKHFKTDLSIILPVDSSGAPDWGFMSDYIKSLEDDYIKSLDAYLQVTGLNDYQLTETDKQTLKEAENKKYKEFEIDDIFTVMPVQRMTMPGKPYVSDKEVIGKGGDTPYIAAISTNNGITGYSDKEPNNPGDCITLSTTAASPETVFYQKEPFIGRQQMSAIRRIDGKPLGEECGLYITTLIKKVTQGFNYANKLTNDHLRNTKIILPVDSSGAPDWGFMSDYIRVMEKLVIKDVVVWKDKELELTRELVGDSENTDQQAASIE